MKSRVGWPNTHIAGESLVSLSGVILYCSMTRWKTSASRSTFLPGVVDDESFDRLNLSTTVTVRECSRRETMVYAPVFEELTSGCGCKFWTTVRYQFLRDSKGHECATQTSDEASSAVM